MKNIWVFSAVSQEQNCLLNNEALEPFVEVIPAGIGLVDFSLSIGRILEKYPWQPKVLAFVGTCGSRENLPPGTVVIPEHALFYDHRVAENKAYIPQVMADQAELFVPDQVKEIFSNFSEKKGAEHIWGGNVASPIGITCESLSSHYKYDWENLEVFALARAGAQIGVPVMAVLGISNRIGMDAHSEWVKNRKIAEKKSCNKIKEILIKLIHLNKFS